MQDVSLVQALGALAAHPQFFVWRLTWSASEGKYHKMPAYPDGSVYRMDASDPTNWMTHDAAVATLERLRAAGPAAQFTLGFYLTEELGYFFLDIDHCVTAGTYSDLCNDWVSKFPGCMVELSSSGTGVHVIGRQVIEPHGKKTPKGELYTGKRGIAFGLGGRAWGCADTPAPALQTFALVEFPAPVGGEDGDWIGPRADWRGSVDDGELLRRALASVSAAARFGSAATFAHLWNNDIPALDRFYGPDTDSERDAALASHLAFWTGCDAPRIERLMRMSALARPKWDEHRTYLRDLTITRACGAQGDVCKDAPRVDVAAQMYTFQPPEPVGPLPALPALPATPLQAAPVVTQAVSPEAKALIESLLDMVGRSTDWDDIHNTVIPAIAAAGVPPALMPRLETAINKRLDLFDAKLPVAKLRALLSPPRAKPTGETDTDRECPEWAKKYVYVRQGDAFHDTELGLGLSRTSFNATHDRDMPIKGDGPMHEDSVMWALHRWNVPIVHDTIYYPGKPSMVQYDGMLWANLYSESSFPQAEEFTADGVAAIEQFKNHLWLLCGQRERVYLNMLSFMAHNVQQPGRKIRWVPIIKGAEGDGKTLIGQVMRAAMGGRNVMSVGPEIVANSGGFTDWAHGRAFLVLEEMYMTGKDRHRIANQIKQFITNNEVTINPKGGKPKVVVNTCNQFAVTNHSDAVPINADGDRRWFVVFTPFGTRAQLYEALGLPSEQHVRAYFDRLFYSLENHAGQWRKWLMELAIPEWFTVNGEAMTTDEKAIMATSGLDDVEILARGIIAEGCHGVGAECLSSSCLSSAMKQRGFAEGIEMPKTTSMHHLLNRLGFMQLQAQVKWNGSPHRVWVKSGVNQSNDNIRAMLEVTRISAQPVTPIGPVVQQFGVN